MSHVTTALCSQLPPSTILRSTNSAETGLREEMIQDVNEGRDALFEDEWGIEQGAGQDLNLGRGMVLIFSSCYEWL